MSFLPEIRLHLAPSLSSVNHFCYSPRQQRTKDDIKETFWATLVGERKPFDDAAPEPPCGRAASADAAHVPSPFRLSATKQQHGKERIRLSDLLWLHQGQRQEVLLGMLFPILNCYHYQFDGRAMYLKQFLSLGSCPYSTLS